MMCMNHNSNGSSKSYKVRKAYFFTWHIVSLFAGSIIYILFRVSSLKMFSWSETLGTNITSNRLRGRSLLIIEHLPDWLLYSLPDGLWVFSYICLMLGIWKKSVSRQNIFWIGIVPFIAIGSEIAQLFGTVQGTFDITDIFCYALGFLLPFLLFNKSINYKFKNVKL